MYHISYSSLPLQIASLFHRKTPPFSFEITSLSCSFFPCVLCFYSNYASPNRSHNWHFLIEISTWFFPTFPCLSQPCHLFTPYWFFYDENKNRSPLLLESTPPIYWSFLWNQSIMFPVGDCRHCPPYRHFTNPPQDSQTLLISDRWSLNSDSFPNARLISPQTIYNLPHLAQSPVITNDSSEMLLFLFFSPLFLRFDHYFAFVSSFSILFVSPFPLLIQSVHLYNVATRYVLIPWWKLRLKSLLLGSTEDMSHCKERVVSRDYCNNSFERRLIWLLQLNYGTEYFDSLCWLFCKKRAPGDPKYNIFSHGG